MIMLPKGDLYEKSLSGVQEVLARSGHAIVITDSHDFAFHYPEKPDQIRPALPVDDTIFVDTDLKLLTPILFNVVNQLFAYYVTTAKGNNVDQPRNLAKSVTVE